MRKSALCRTAPLAVARREPQGVRRKRGPKPKPLQQLWSRPGPGGGPYRRSATLGSLPTASERLKRATRKSTALRGLPGTVSPAPTQPTELTIGVSFSPGSFSPNPLQTRTFNTVS